MRLSVRCIGVSASLLLGAGLISAALVVWLGLYDVSARTPHWKVTRWVLEVARERSVEIRSGSVAMPDPNVPGRVEKGIGHLHEMCRLCHGAPGHPKSEFAAGLYPAPPDLREPEIQQAGDRALFWIVKNGFKMTGMPAFGVNHSDEEIAGIVAVVRKLPRLTPEGYRALLPVAAETHEHGL